MKRISQVFIILMVMLVTSCSTPAPEEPDVLLVILDDLNDWAGCLGGKDGVYTPNLDKLASEGVLFTNAQTAAPLSNASRTALLTGMFPSTSGVYSNRSRWQKSPALGDVQTLPAYFREKGYRVLGAGKVMHHNYYLPLGEGADQNDTTLWDAYYPTFSLKEAWGVWPDSSRIDSLGNIFWLPLAGPYTEDRPSYYMDWAPLGKEDQHGDARLVEWAVDQLKERYEQPLFMAVGLDKPHWPWFVPKAYFDMYPLDELVRPKVLEDDLEDIPEAGKQLLQRDVQQWMLDHQQWDSAVLAYQASVSFADEMLGKLIRGLRKSGRMKNTILVVCSDNGMHLGEKKHWGSHSLWEEATHVPLLILGPGMEEGRLCQEAVSLADIYPTLLELTGQPVPEEMDGVSLLPLLKDPEAVRTEPALSTHHYQNHSIRTERWRYIRYENGTEELYDHWNDEDEFYNLAKEPEHQEVIQELRKHLPRINQEELL